MKKLLAVILAAASVISLASFTASAETADENTKIITVGEVEYIFEADFSDEHINSFIETCENDEHGVAETASYNPICSVFGHNIKTSSVETITHKERATAPRCLRRIYDVEACTRCDYTSSTLISSLYIQCC